MAAEEGVKSICRAEMDECKQYVVRLLSLSYTVFVLGCYVDAVSK